MTSLSKEIAAEDHSTRKKEQKVVETGFTGLPDDVFLVVWSFVDFVTLCRVKPVCKWWMESIDRGIDARLGKKPFMLEDEQEPDPDGRKCNEILCIAVIKYCFCKGHELPKYCKFPIKSKSEYAEELASTYGWPIGDWDVSQVTNFSSIFNCMTSFNEEIGDWNVSKATAFNGMFWKATSFNKDLSPWKTGNVTNMKCMFFGATSFNQDLSCWNTANVTYMSCMFFGATSFNQDLSSWSTGNVIDMSFMLCCATSFNQDLSRWSTGNVTDMSFMLCCATSFNQDLSRWNTGNVTYMDSMFYEATSFNQDISSWDVTSVDRIARNMLFGVEKSFTREFAPCFREIGTDLEDLIFDELEDFRLIRRVVFG